jgi:low temperature requirement protein LtrA
MERLARIAPARDEAGVMSEGLPSVVSERHASWAELFFDLVFVFAVTEVSSLLGADRSWSGAFHALVVFVPIYWVWVGVTVQADVHDLTTPMMRIVVFAVALGGMFMALAVPDAYTSRGVLFALSYWASRVVLGVALFHRRWSINPFTISMVVTGPVLLAGALVHGDARLALWAVAALIDLSSPSLLRSRLQGMTFDAVHLAERFGLFVLIAVGESVVSIGIAAHETGPVTWAVGVVVAIGFVVSCGLWWVYFYFAADAVRHALATAPVQLDITRRVLSYGHLAFIVGVIAVAVGLRDAVTAASGPGSSSMVTGSIVLAYGGTALYLATFGYTRWMMFHQVSTTRLAAAAVVLALLPLVVWADPPSWLVLAVQAVVLIVLNAVEWRRVTRRS